MAGVKPTGSCGAVFDAPRLRSLDNPRYVSVAPTGLNRFSCFLPRIPLRFILGGFLSLPPERRGGESGGAMRFQYTFTQEEKS
jgi:hypothetical protein